MGFITLSNGQVVHTSQLPDPNDIKVIVIGAGNHIEREVVEKIANGLGISMSEVIIGMEDLVIRIVEPIKFDLVEIEQLYTPKTEYLDQPDRIPCPKPWRKFKR